MNESGVKSKLRSVETADILKLLPHRYPFLLVDRIVDMDGDRSAMGIKNVAANEPYFQGHFPGFSILPGVLIIEIMAQAASFSVYPYMAASVALGVESMARQFQCILVGVDSARFRKPVVPGDTLRIETTVTKCRGRLWAFQCTALVDGQRVAEADLMANLISTSDSTDGAVAS